MSRNDAGATERAKRVWDRQARHFDKQMGFWGRRLFRGDREWACGQARGEALEGDAQALPFDDASFDTVVCTYSLCSIPGDTAAVREMRRVLRPGGTLVFAEHVASHRPVVRAVQWLIHQVTHRLALEHMLREPREVLAAAGLEPVTSQRRRAGIVDRIVVRKPAAPTRLPPDGHASEATVP